MSVLREAKKLIEKKENWCQVKLVNILPDGKQFCSLGAVWAAHQNNDQNQKKCGFYLQRALESRKKPINIAAFNDTHTHAEVMQLWDEAIALEEACDERG